jgi:hypothetical protein
MSKVAIAGNASGTGTFTIASPNSNSDRTLTLPDEAGTVLTSASTLRQNSGPAFFATHDNQFSMSTQVTTKLQYSNERFDTDNCYDPSLYRFTPNVAGYYQINATIYYSSAGSGYARLYFYKNGSPLYNNVQGNMLPLTSVTGIIFQAAQVIYMNGSTDYLEMYGWQSSGGNLTTGGEAGWSGCLLRAA